MITGNQLFMRSAWEGAKVFRSGNLDEAQQVADRLQKVCHERLEAELKHYRSLGYDLPSLRDRERDIAWLAMNSLKKEWQVDSEWSLPLHDGFRWWAHRLEQQVTVESYLDGTDFLRAVTTVVNEVSGQESAIQLMSKLNQRTGTFALYYDVGQRSITAITSATMMSWYHPTHLWFAEAAMLQLCQAEAWANAIAAEVGGKIAISEHPVKGPRRQPDQMLELIEWYEAGRNG